MDIKSAILQRKTEKVMCDIASHKDIPDDIAKHNQDIVLSAIKTAGWAPFHYARDVQDISEPWRVHILWHDDVKKVANYLLDELNVTTKEPQLTAACSVLILVTWLPQFYDLASRSESQINVDEEHLAASSAMVQNLLLLLTSHHMGTYWGSGGIFRKPEMFSYLGIPQNERMLGAIHVEYPEMMDSVKQRKPGKHRNNRCDKWIREISI